MPFARRPVTVCSYRLPVSQAALGLTLATWSVQATLAQAGRRQLTVSVVPQYGDAIMDAESDGFPGLVASEISADAEAAALTEQFMMTVRHAHQTFHSGQNPVLFATRVWLVTLSQRHV